MKRGAIVRMQVPLAATVAANNVRLVIPMSEWCRGGVEIPVEAAVDYFSRPSHC
jgi:hypothetical protein